MKVEIDSVKNLPSPAPFPRCIMGNGRRDGGEHGGGCVCILLKYILCLLCLIFSHLVPSPLLGSVGT